jgi:hypothetical protein
MRCFKTAQRVLVLLSFFLFFFLLNNALINPWNKTDQRIYIQKRWRCLDQQWGAEAQLGDEDVYVGAWVHAWGAAAPSAKDGSHKGQHSLGCQSPSRKRKDPVYVRHGRHVTWTSEPGKSEDIGQHSSSRSRKMI